MYWICLIRLLQAVLSLTGSSADSQWARLGLWSQACLDSNRMHLVGLEVREDGQILLGHDGFAEWEPCCRHGDVGLKTLYSRRSFLMPPCHHHGWPCCIDLYNLWLRWQRLGFFCLDEGHVYYDAVACAHSKTFVGGLQTVLSVILLADLVDEHREPIAVLSACALHRHVCGLPGHVSNRQIQRDQERYVAHHHGSSPELDCLYGRRADNGHGRWE